MTKSLVLRLGIPSVLTTTSACNCANLKLRAANRGLASQKFVRGAPEGGPCVRRASLLTSVGCVEILAPTNGGGENGGETADWVVRALRDDWAGAVRDLQEPRQAPPG